MLRGDAKHGARNERREAHEANAGAVLPEPRRPPRCEPREGEEPRALPPPLGCHLLRELEREVERPEGLRDPPHARARGKKGGITRTENDGNEEAQASYRYAQRAGKKETAGKQP